jgi:hypothetical protein
MMVLGYGFDLNRRFPKEHESLPRFGTTGLGGGDCRQVHDSCVSLRVVFVSAVLSFADGLCTSAALPEPPSPPPSAAADTAPNRERNQ